MKNVYVVNKKCFDFKNNKIDCDIDDIKVFSSKKKAREYIESLYYNYDFSKLFASEIHIEKDSICAIIMYTCNDEIMWQMEKKEII